MSIIPVLSTSRRPRYLYSCAAITATCLLASSTDDAMTFSRAIDVTAEVKPKSLHWGWYATTFSAVQLKFNTIHRGRLVACAGHVVGHWSAYPITTGHSHKILSDDHGKSWRAGGSVPFATTNECSIAELKNGTLVMNSHNYVGHPVHRFISHSHDGGESWPIGWLAHDLPDPIVF